MKTRAALAAFALVLVPALAAAGPVADVDVGALKPSGETRYTDRVDGGPHVAVRAAWLFPVGDFWIGPTAIAGYTRYGHPDDIDGVSRWRFLGGARIETRQDRLSLVLNLAAGVDRPHYDFRETLEAACGDPTTSGVGLEASVGAMYGIDAVRLGGIVGVAKGYHGDDRPQCKGGIVVDVLDYESTDLFLQATVGWKL